MKLVSLIIIAVHFFDYVTFFFGISNNQLHVLKYTYITVQM